MSKLTQSNTLQKSSGKYILLLCAAAIVINIVLSSIAAALGIPIYLDTAGTVIAAALGGYLPGITVGFLTNIIRGIADTSNVYYTILNMLTAVFTAYFAGKGFFKKTFKPLLLIPILAIAVGIPDSVLSWFFNGCRISAEAKYVWYLIEHTGLGAFPSQLTVDILTELADKAVTIIIAIILLKLIPDKLSERFKAMSPWQSPLSDEVKEAVRNSKCRSASFRTKILLILIIASLLIAGSAATISFMLFKTSTLNEHIKLASGLTELAADSIDADMVDDYIENGDKAEGYAETEEMLYKLKNSSPDVEYIYVYKIMDDGCHVVFDLDTEDMEGSEPGEIIEFDESFTSYIPSLLAGEEIDPIITDDTYGWLLTVYKPVYDDNGVCRCYAAVDISMNLLSEYGYNFLARLISLLLAFFILIIAIGTWLIENNLILPVNTMAYCAGAFAYNSDEAREESVERLKSLDIRTGDEIENLYSAFLKTTEDSMHYIADIQHKTETISKMQNGLIMVLADMVESRDKCTGDHVRKTAAYAKLIMQEMKKRGMYKDQLTDEFIENVTNAAPLHDIGKIYISDVILNKPGKLTDEEFDTMKSHTTLGSTIIDRAIDMVPDSGYLEEAKNLSEYHHEKWNGKGYPHGKSGEDIPLSARIMAVADVFDALVSRRSYKTPFSFEKAMSIIREDAGTHFDPLVAEAFLGAVDKVRKIAEEFEEKEADE